MAGSYTVSCDIESFQVCDTVLKRLFVMCENHCVISNNTLFNVENFLSFECSWFKYANTGGKVLNLYFYIVNKTNFDKSKSIKNNTALL